MTPSRPQGFSDSFRARDFHITSLHTCADGSRIATARKRTLRDVVIETFTHLMVPGADPQRIAAPVPSVL